MDTMTKTYRFDSQTDARKAWPAGKGAWFDGHADGNLWIVTGTDVSFDAGNSRWTVEVTFRSATAQEFIAARLRWLDKERLAALTNCRYGMVDAGRLERECRAKVVEIMVDAGRLERECRAKVVEIDAEIATLRSAQ
jgi:hypothetical protein